MVLLERHFLLDGPLSPSCPRGWSLKNRPGKIISPSGSSARNPPSPPGWRVRIRYAARWTSSTLISSSTSKIFRTASGGEWKQKSRGKCALKLNFISWSISKIFRTASGGEWKKAWQMHLEFEFHHLINIHKSGYFSAQWSRSWSTYQHSRLPGLRSD